MPANRAAPGMRNALRLLAIALATRAPGWSVRLSTLAMAGWPHRTSPPLHLDVLVVIDPHHQDGDLCLFLLCPQGRI